MTNDNGLRRAVVGGLAVVGVAIVLGLVAFTLLISAQRTVSPAQLVGSDTQLLLVLQPNLREAANIELLRSQYRPLFDDGVPSPAGLLIDALLNVDYSSDVARWIGPEMAVAVSGLNDANLPNSVAALSEQGHVVFIFSSRDDPTAARFIDQQLIDRKAQGERFSDVSVGLITIHVQEDAGNSPVAAFGLLKHYVVYSNSVDAIRAMIERDPEGQDTLAANPRYLTTRQALEGSSAGFMYLDRPATNWLVDVATTAGQQGEQFAPLQELTNLALGLQLLPAGVELELVAPLSRSADPIDPEAAGQAMLMLLQQALSEVLALSNQPADILAGDASFVFEPATSEVAGTLRSRLLLAVDER
jgi:hypothetical protein